MRRSRKIVSGAVALLLGSGLLAACGDGGSTAPSATGTTRTLVVDNSFDLKTLDPGRQYEPTGGMIAKAIYQTVITFEGADMTSPVPQLADFTESSDHKLITLTVKDGHTFSDGSPVTADDVLFSLQRVQGLKGNPAFLLDGVTITKTGDKTIELATKDARPELAGILANPALGIVNSKVVKANGGGLTADDKAETSLNKTSAGSGPYMIDTADIASQVTLVKNPKYTGTAPAFDKVVFRNSPGSTQLINVQGGDSQIALDLSPQQAAQLDKAKVNLLSAPSPTIVFLFANQNPSVSAITAKPGFAKAVRAAVDYQRLVELAGVGAVQAGGVIPSVILGGLKADASQARDLTAAKAALAEAGYKGEEIKLAYANDLSVQGIELQQFAAAIQSQLKEAGINVVLAPSPVATELDGYRKGTEQLGLWYWNPDYAHPAGYLVFAPDKLVGLRAGWTTDTAVTAAADKAAATTGDAQAAAYQDFQKALNATGPFIPLIQPAKSVGYAKTIAEPVTNPLWTLDVALVKPA